MEKQPVKVASNIGIGACCYKGLSKTACGTANRTQVNHDPTEMFCRVDLLPATKLRFKATGSYARIHQSPLLTLSRTLSFLFSEVESGRFGKQSFTPYK